MSHVPEQEVRVGLVLIWEIGGRDGRKTSFHVVDFEEEGMRKDLDRVRVATNLAEGVSGTGPATHVGETIPGMAESETQVPTAEELDLQIEEGSSE